MMVKIDFDLSQVVSLNMATGRLVLKPKPGSNLVAHCCTVAGDTMEEFEANPIKREAFLKVGKGGAMHMRSHT